MQHTITQMMQAVGMDTLQRFVHLFVLQKEKTESRCPEPPTRNFVTLESAVQTPACPQLTKERSLKLYNTFEQGGQLLLQQPCLSENGGEMLVFFLGEWLS